MDTLPTNIASAVRAIKSAIIKTQSRVAANANAEMLSLYFGIGQYVSHKTKTEKWGTGVIDIISAQLQKEMPGLRGFNIRNMRQFFENWAENLIWQTPSAKLEGQPNSDTGLSQIVGKVKREGLSLKKFIYQNLDSITSHSLSKVCK